MEYLVFYYLVGLLTLLLEWNANYFFMSSSMKNFLEKFFDLCREYKQEITPKKMAEVLRDYSKRLDG